MLKFNFILVLGLVTLSTAYSQGQKGMETDDSLTARKRFVSNVELLFGSGMVFFRGDEFYKENRVQKAGFSANVALVHNLNSRLQLKSLIAYEIKGSRLIINSINADYNPPAEQKHLLDLTLDYATATVFAKYTPLKTRGLFVGCGPYISYLVREKLTSKVYINGTLTTSYAAINDPGINYKWYDAGLAFTAGVDVRVAQKRQGTLQLIYQRGMTDINQPIIAQIRNHTISILVGITIK